MSPLPADARAAAAGLDADECVGAGLAAAGDGALAAGFGAAFASFAAAGVFVSFAAPAEGEAA